MIHTDPNLAMVRCSKHTHHYYTNYCCRTYTPLCPSCVDGHIKNLLSQGIKPEVDTLKKVRDMCSLKTIGIAKVLEEELKKLGFNSSRPTEFFIQNTVNTLEDTRKKLHRVIDEYVDILKSSFYSKYQNESGGVLSDMKGLVKHIQMEVDKLYRLNRSLKGNIIL